VDEMGITSTSFFSSLGTRACLHSTVINSGKGSEAMAEEKDLAT